MAAKFYIFYTLATVVMLAMSNYGVYGDDEDDGCPDVKDLICSQSQPAQTGCRKTATITLEDGTECPGCQFCIEDGVVSLGREFGKQCPPMPCPAIALPENCNATTYSQKVNLLGSDCDACDATVCI